MKRFLTAVTCTTLLCLAIVGLDSVAHAATCRCLILGHLNRVITVNRVKISGNGPALALKGHRATALPSEPNTWSLICGATAAGTPTAWSESIDQPAQLTLTRVDTVVSGNLAGSTP